MHHGLPLQVSPEVQEAFRTQKGVVALESTIISHGALCPAFGLDVFRSRPWSDGNRLIQTIH